MKSIINILEKHWNTNPPASSMQLDELERELKIALPSDYRQLMQWSNGGEGKVGGAYFSLWPIEKIINRNISANIWRYMSNRFIGIGSNGGGECYGLDYTENDTSPNISIVPLGDLCRESKFIIAPTLTNAVQMALDGLFDDGEYNSKEGGPLTQEILQIRKTNARIKLQNLWEKKDYQGYVDLANGDSSVLTSIDLKKLQLAKKFLK